MLKKSCFFEFLNRRADVGFASLLADHVADVDYIEWNGYLLPQHYGDAEHEYHAIRNNCAVFDASPIRKIRIQHLRCCWPTESSLKRVRW